MRMKKRLHKLILPLLFISVATSYGNRKTDKAWAAFEPPADEKYDWIQLTSREWLKGELIMLVDNSVEFDSDEFDVRIFDLEDVKQIRTANRQKILVETSRPSLRHFWRFKPSSLREIEVKEMVGQIKLEDDLLTITDEDDVTNVSRAQIVAIAQEANKERERWGGDLSLGLTAMSGNSDTADFTAWVKLYRRTARSRYRFEYTGNFSTASKIEVVNNHRINAAYDRFMMTRFYLQIIGMEIYHDPFSNIRFQYSLHSGAGYYLILNDRINWSVGSALGYQKTQYETVQAPASDESESPFLAFTMHYDQELTDKIDLLYEYTMRWLNEESGTYTHYMLGQVELELTDDLDFDISMVWDRIENPTADEDGILPEKDDYRLMVGLSYEF
jgi:putative salt-induced outer membrane protein YdiY